MYNELSRQAKVNQGNNRSFFVLLEEFPATLGEGRNPRGEESTRSSINKNSNEQSTENNACTST